MVRLPELLLPAGGFDAAVAAFDGGADAIYLGLRDFSARRQAKNFDDLEYRRILRLARDSGRRVYVAMNTVVTDEELPAVAERLAFLSRFRPDALIFQDLGLARLAAVEAPELELHASTQTAVQTDGAVELLRGLGVTRAVLPRETTLLELSERAAADPDMEFEVFVHGALCYSFSGLCLASGLTRGRSGNRGECAQLCRSWYSGTGGMRGEGYWFSCRDLDLSGRLGDLAAAGARSLKVEGRMKSPEYVHAVAAYYRAALDRLEGGGPSDAEFARLESASRVTFSRGPTSGWFGHHGGQAIIDASFPFHRGIHLGTIESTRGDSILVALEAELLVRDGLQYVADAAPGSRAASVRFSVLELRDAATDRRIFEGRPGMKVAISLEGLDPSERALLLPGRRLSKISSRALDRRARSPEEYPPALVESRARIGFTGMGEARGYLELDLGRLGGGQSLARRIDLETPLVVERSRKPGSFGRALAVFGESGDFDFRLEVLESEQPMISDSGEALDFENLFIPPSSLKRFKNEAYENIATLIKSLAADRAADALAAAVRADPRSVEGRAYPTAGRIRLPGPPRRELVFPDRRMEGGMPFATPALLAEGRPLPAYEGWSWLPLAPLVLATEDYLETARGRIMAELEAGQRVVVGLGALHHLAFAKELYASEAVAPHLERLAFWIDFNLYVANRATLAYMDSVVPAVGFAYSWLEAPPGKPALDSSDEGCLPVIEVGAGFNAPLFLSKACLIRQHVGKGHCPAPCGKRLAAPLRDRDREFVVVVEDCISMLFRGAAP